MILKVVSELVIHVDRLSHQFLNVHSNGAILSFVEILHEIGLVLVGQQRIHRGCVVHDAKDVVSKHELYDRPRSMQGVESHGKARDAEEHKEENYASRRRQRLPRAELLLREFCVFRTP